MLAPDRLCVALSFARLKVRSLVYCLVRSFGLRVAIRGMIFHRLRIRPLALKMLARDGFAAIWVLHLSASRAYREGNKAVAAVIIEIADAAEREWLRRGNAALRIRHWQG
jgi:hypothetical protein